MAAVRLATRGSPLALWQARRVAELLGAGQAGPVELVVVQTTGDRRRDVSLADLGAQGVFAKEVQAAVLAGDADAAVHSAKDLPSLTPVGLVLAAVPERADVRDALVGASLDQLPTGALIATSSVRRRAQLAWLRPDLGFVDLRGNIDSRLRRAQATGGGVVAACALDRLGLSPPVIERLDPSLVLPQVGQGAIAVECRADDQRLLQALVDIDDPVAHRALLAERAFLAELGGGCSLPVGALASIPAGVAGPIDLQGMLASRDGGVLLRRRRGGDDPAILGRTLALELLDDCGGRDLGDWSDARPLRP